MARGQEYAVMQNYSSFSLRNPAFTGIMQTRGLFSHYKWEGEPQSSQHQRIYIIGYEERLSEKAGSIGCRVLTQNEITNSTKRQNRQFHLQYANAVKGANKTWLLGCRAGFGDQIRRSAFSATHQSGIGTYFSAGAALLLKKFYVGAGLLNLYSSGFLARRTSYYDATRGFTLQTAGFIEVNQANPRLFIAPAFDLDLRDEDEVQVSLKLNVASPRLSGGAAMLINENGLLPEVNFGYLSESVRAGYSLAVPLGDDFSTGNIIFQLHLGLFLSDLKGESGNMAYYFRHLF